MFKRLFFAMLGLGAGVALGIWAVRKIDETRAKMSPQGVADSAASTAASFKERMDVAVAEGRKAAQEKESELRGVYRVNPQPE